MNTNIQVELFAGKIRAFPQSGRPTAIYKEALAFPAEIGPHGFVDDEQADRNVHGGPEKAIHLYPAAHYAKLSAAFALAAEALRPGSMGENISTPALDEHDVHLGDIWQLGSAHIQICQPRSPCWKIDERFAVEDMAKYIADHGLTGWYWRVLQPGRVHAGDPLKVIQIASNAPTLHEAMRLWTEHRPNLNDLQQLANTPGIASHWQRKIEQRLNWLKGLSD